MIKKEQRLLFSYISDTKPIQTHTVESITFVHLLFLRFLLRWLGIYWVMKCRYAFPLPLFLFLVIFGD